MPTNFGFESLLLEFIQAIISGHFFHTYWYKARDFGCTVQ